MSSAKTLFLLDGHALVYRAHYAFIARPLLNSKGWNVSAINGFVRMLWDLIHSQQPTHLAVAFDPHGPTFRNDQYPDYKANREAQPEDISFALPYIRKILEAMRIPVLEIPGFEADDTIGTIAKKAEAEGYTVYMMTSDKDYGQLVSERIFMYKPGMKGGDVQILGPREVCETWDIERPEQVIDILGLQGDSVDNIPGLPGVGPKTAATLLKTYGSVENIIANVDQLKGKVQEIVRTKSDLAVLSKQLATIALNVPIEFDERDYLLEPFNKEALAELFKELEFRGIAKEILGNDLPGHAPKEPGAQGDLFGSNEMAPPAAAPENLNYSAATNDITNTTHVYHLADTTEKITSLVNLLEKQTSFCFDTETTDIDATLAELVGFSFAIAPHEAWYVPIPSQKEAAKKIVDLFKPVLENEAIEKTGQNIKYDALILRFYDVQLKGIYWDTMIAHYLLEPELRHNMDYLSETYLKYKPVSITALIGNKGKNQLSMRDVAVDKVAEYAAEDADITLQLRNYLEPWLKKENLYTLFSTVEAPLVKVLTEMEYNGVKVDTDYLNNYSTELAQSILTLEAQVYAAAGERFNISSPKQVGELLFDKLKLGTGKKTKTGQYSTDEDTLLELAEKHEVPKLILQYRGLTKLKSTYVDALPALVNPKTGRIHSSFNQALAATGRLSSQNPNLQNIPIRTPEGARVRKAFIPRDENHILLSADYSQIELRLIAEIAKESAMLEAFSKNQDIHQATAARVFDVPYQDVTKEQRNRAKTVNFSIIYGAGAQNLSRQLNIPRAEASELIKQYFNRYEGLRQYMENTVKNARDTGFVTTLIGRRRLLRNINSRNGLDRSNAERMAINTPIQGTAADMIKLAMIHIHEAMQEQKMQSKLILQVHDELVFDVWKPELESLKILVEEKMKNAIAGLQVPIEVGLGTGVNWLEAH